MKGIVLFACLALAGCSAATADPQDDYARTTDCQMAVGLMAGWHPDLTKADRKRYLDAFNRFNAHAATLGSQLGKNENEIDLDKRAVFARYHSELKKPEKRKQYADDIVKSADQCLAA